MTEETCLSASAAALRPVTAPKLQLSLACSCLQTYLALLSLPLAPPHPPPDGSITGATLRELLKLSLSVCVSSSVQVEPSNLLTTQEKREWTRRESSLQMTPAGSHRLLDSAGRLSPSFISRGPWTPIFRRSHIGPFCMVGPKQLCSAEKSHNNQIG